MCIRDRCKTDYYGKNSGMFMIDLENDLVLNLGKPAIARDRAATKVGDLYPVSYTHLDVYKRQICGSTTTMRKLSCARWRQIS